MTKKNPDVTPSAAPVMELLKRYRFQAAHRLVSAPAGDPEGRVHGHGYEVEVYVRGPVDPVMGWVMDYGDITDAAKPLLTQLDHHFLNDIQGLSDPTAEAIARWIYARLITTLPLLDRVEVVETKERRGVYPDPDDRDPDDRVVLSDGDLGK